MTTITQKVNYFLDIRIEDGKFLGTSFDNEQDYLIKQIYRYGNGDTHITYLDGAEEITMVQRKGKSHSYREY